jgi:putative ABC transport system substrate-binding protein
MKRRDLFIGATLAVVGAGRARAQQPPQKSRLVIVHVATPVTSMLETGLSHYAALFGELRKLGYVEADNLTVLRFSGEGRPERYGEIAREVVRVRPDVIFAVGARLVKSLQAESNKIPIVGLVYDPLGNGFATSLSRPGGNITGVSADAGLEIMGKFIEILREIRPSLSKVGFLTPRDWADTPDRALRGAAGQVGVTLVGPSLESPLGEDEYRRVTLDMMRQGAEAILVSEAPENFAHRTIIVGLADRHRIPFLYPLTEYVRIGGLLSYSVDNEERHRMIARYIDHVLKGTDPANLPFFQPTNYLMTINLRLANTLGLTIPPTLLARADEVIE